MRGRADKNRLINGMLNAGYTVINVVEVEKLLINVDSIYYAVASEAVSVRKRVVRGSCNASQKSKVNFVHINLVQHH